jgi:prepilin-type N-terminal cleavage/methylation domain-containing protein
MTIPTRKRSGFTLIELLTVIAIIGILAAVLFPGVQGVMKKAKMSTASTKIRNIAQAYISFASTGNKYIKNAPWAAATANTSASTLPEWAAVLAYNADLNAAELWYVDADKKNETAAFPKQILTGVGAARVIADGFKNVSADSGYHSWATYVPVPKNLTETLPLIWTRGLGADGKWDIADGVWGSDGGHIAWGDSHVTWVSDTSSDENMFTSKTDGTPNADWNKAVTTTTVTALESK